VLARLGEAGALVKLPSSMFAMESRRPAVGLWYHPTHQHV